MRKLIAVLAAVALASGAAATTAGAQTVTKFSVLAIGKGHRITGGFEIRGKLVEPGNRSEVVGSFEARFKGRNHLRFVGFFPDGKLKASGNDNHHKIPIVGGTRRWNGASGKLVHRSAGNNAELLTFTVVQ